VPALRRRRIGTLITVLKNFVSESKIFCYEQLAFKWSVIVLSTAEYRLLVEISAILWLIMRR
jgi:hypothetical protein